MDKQKQHALLQRQLVEDLFYNEARLLDEWRLEEWMELLTEDVSYELPATDARENYQDALGLIFDNAERLKQRVKQLVGGSTWCENPRSRTHRMISNVSILKESENTLEVAANFIIHRFGNDRSDTFVGKYNYLLLAVGESFKIQRRKVILDHQSLYAQGKISIIL